MDETTLAGMGFDEQAIRHATVVQPRDDETPGAYAERLRAYNEAETLAIAEAMLAEAADTNPAMSPGSTHTDRVEAIRVLQDGIKNVARERPGETPPAGGVADNRPTAPGLGEAVRRLQHHSRMIGLCLDEMQRGPGGTPWGFAERLSLDDLYTLLDTASVLTFNAAVIVTDTSNLTPTPAT